MISNPIPWPNGARCAVAITWVMDADSGLNYWNPERADTMVASQTLPLSPGFPANQGFAARKQLRHEPFAANGS